MQSGEEALEDSEPGRGVRVVTADLATLLDAYALREVVEAQHAAPDPFDRLEGGGR